LLKILFETLGGNIKVNLVDIWSAGVRRRLPVVVVARDDTYEAVLTNIKEIRARKSPLLALVEEGNEDINALTDAVIFVPKVDPLFSPVVNTVVLQLIAYYVARERGCPIDFPRNLTKTVTVE
jgi:glucosamine--fructose-6-phosphate aminotransferase (isomerizing)